MATRRPAGPLKKPAARSQAGKPGKDKKRIAGFGNWEERLWREGYRVVAGTDEAGRGPLAGPVVAAAFAVLAREDLEVRELLAMVADSKCMTAQKREEAFEQITDGRFKGRIAYAIAESSVQEIDSQNILRAALLAMSRSVQQMNPLPDCVLVDGCNRPPELLAPGECWTRGRKAAASKAKGGKSQSKLSSFFKPSSEEKAAVQADKDAAWRPSHVEAVIRGDGRVPSISAASVLAKVHRDRLMAELDRKFPAYGFEGHKGYGTRQHLDAIKEHGPCLEHRRSFRPVQEALGLPREKRKRSEGKPSQEECQENEEGEEEELEEDQAASAGSGAEDPEATPAKRPRRAPMQAAKAEETPSKPAAKQRVTGKRPSPTK